MEVVVDDAEHGEMQVVYERDVLIEKAIGYLQMLYVFSMFGLQNYEENK